MTRSDLGPVIEGQERLWMPPFMLCVIGHEEVFNALGPYVGPGGNIEPGAHFWRTVTPFKTGYLNRGDGSYAARLRGTHGQRGVSRHLLSQATAWNVSIVCHVATVSGLSRLQPEIVSAGKQIAIDFDADPGAVNGKQDQLRRTFQGVTILPEMREAFWMVVGWNEIHKALGQPANAAAVLATCGRFLPSSFVNQFRR